jgi:hypothetical protein
MSADNCVAIGRFLEDGQYTYRVVHALIENCDNSDDFPKDVTDANRVLYFSESPVFADEATAFIEANRIYDDEIAEEEIPILEHGILFVQYDEPFPKMTKEEARKMIDDLFEINSGE